MNFNFKLGLPVLAFVLEGLARYQDEHNGDSPAELVLHPAHRDALYADLAAELPGVPPPWVPCEECWINGVLLVENPACRIPYFVSEDRRRWEL